MGWHLGAVNWGVPVAMVIIKRSVVRRSILWIIAEIFGFRKCEWKERESGKRGWRCHGNIDYYFWSELWLEAPVVQKRVGTWEKRGGEMCGYSHGESCWRDAFLGCLAFPWGILGVMPEFPGS